MNLSSISSRSVIGRLLRLPLTLIPSTLAMPILQGPLVGYRWIAGSSDHGCWLGSFEYHKQRLIARMLGAGDVVFDVGANVGFYTLVAAARVRPRGLVVAFEPLPQNIRVLQQHLRINNIDRVQVIEAAAGNRSGSTRFAPHASNAMGKVSDDGSIVVDEVAIDELCDAHTIPDPTFLKIDVEGAELSVLEGACRTLRRARPTIFLATHGPQIHQQCCDFLRGAGYSLRPVDESIPSINGTDEILATPSDTQ